jgi:RNA polymerase sigma factor (sigma-70 family)
MQAIRPKYAIHLHMDVGMCNKLLDSDISTSFDQSAPLVLSGSQRYLACLQNRRNPMDADVEAWGHFYLLCDPLLRRFAVSCRVLPGDVDDCVQSSWKQITADLPSFRDDGKTGRLAAWLHAIVRGKGIDLQRYRDRHPTRSLLSHRGAWQTSRDEDPAAKCERHRERTRVTKVLTKLCRQVFTINYRAFQMRWMEGCTVKEVAQELDLTVSQVRYRCYRVKLRFRFLYERELKKTGRGLE